LMIRLLGQSEYGLYAMIGSISAYLSIMDMGLGNAIIRYTARNRAIGNDDSQSNLNGMFVVLYSLIGIVTVIVGVILYNSVEHIFSGSLNYDELKKAKTMLIILTANFSISFPLMIFGAYMEAYEKFIVVRLVSIV